MVAIGGKADVART